jgi:hypothetical protein
MSEFYRYFKENMDALNLTSPPESLFATQALAVATINTFVAFIDKFGTKVTVMEVVGAGTRLEQLAVVGTVGAAYYTGALIGSLAVATGRTLSGGTSLADVLYEATKWKLNRPWVTTVLHRNPGIYDPSVPGRKYCRTYRFMR